MKKITVADVMDTVDRVRPNAMSRDLKIKYLNEVELEVAELLSRFEFEKPEEIPAMDWGDPLELGNTEKPREALVVPEYSVGDLSAVCLLPERFGGVYVAYITAKIDFAEDETENYQNDAQMYQAEKDTLTGFLLRNYKHKETRVRGLF